MASKQYQPYELSKKVVIGPVKSERVASTGANVAKLDESSAFTLHYGAIKRTFDQKYALVGTTLQDTVLIVVRHNPKIIEKMRARLPNSAVEYNIIDVSVDDSNYYITYDILTLSKVTKGGGA